MNKLFKLSLVFLAATILATACSKPPTVELESAKSAVDSAVSEGAEQYAAEDLQKLNAQMEQALAEIKTQDGKFLFKSYEEATAALGQVKAAADELKVKVAQRKAELKAEAEAALTAAQTAVQEAKDLLDVAPKGKGSMADIAAMKNDVAGLEAELVNIQPQIDAGEFSAASEKAQAIAQSAQAISNDVRAAQEKMGK